MGYYSSFVVRIWISDGPKIIRGQVQHVDTDESMYFLEPDAMLSFMFNHLDPAKNNLAQLENQHQVGNSNGD
jgi:hypothetical protein